MTVSGVVPAGLAEDEDEDDDGVRARYDGNPNMNHEPRVVQDAAAAAPASRPEVVAHEMP